MTTKQEEKTAYQRLHDLEDELAGVLKRIRWETYLAMQEAMRLVIEGGEVVAGPFLSRVEAEQAQADTA